MNTATVTDPSHAILRPLRRKQSIGLTALIDVVFILLMFFMLTTNFIHYKVLDISIPTGNSTPENTVPPALLVLRNDDTFILSVSEHSAPQKFLSISKVVNSIQADSNNKSDDSESVLILLPETDVPLQYIINTLQQLSDAEIRASLGKTLDPEVGSTWN